MSTTYLETKHFFKISAWARLSGTMRWTPTSGAPVKVGVSTITRGWRAEFSLRQRLGVFISFWRRKRGFRAIDDACKIWI
jgi:hypothetical protein